MQEAYIFDAVRTPRGKGKKYGALHEVKPIDLVNVVMNALMERNPFDTKYLDDLILGCVTPIGEQGGNIAKAAALFAGWDDSVPGMQINRLCASGLEAINMAASKVRSGWAQLIIAGGTESMSRIPMGSDGGPLLYDPAVNAKVLYIPQGISADLIASLEGFSREQVDTYALQSQQRAAFAETNGYFKKSMIPVRDINGLPVLEKEEYIRPDSTMERLAQLAPAFKSLGRKGFDAMTLMKYPFLERIHHVHTAGNSSGIVDGAAAVLIGSKAIGSTLGLTPRARIISAVSVGSEPTIMLQGTTPASKKALKLAGMEAKDIDLWEMNEAFAAPVLKFQQDMDLNPELLNVNGGAIAMGHPLGATGAMLMGTLLDELERRDLQTGLVTLCVGGGMGISTIIERV